MRLTILALPSLALGSLACADVSLPSAFTEHMVLQRDRPARIYGMAQPNEQVAVELRDSKGMAVRSGKTVAGQGGRFAVELAALAGSAEPLTLEVRGANTVTVGDIVVGDVWVAGGQSNMEWQLGATGAQLKEGTSLAGDPQVRFLRVEKRTSNHAEFTVPGAWEVLSPESAPRMGAVGFWFALALRKEAGVPVGIIESNWGGTRAEPWTDRPTLGAEPIYTDRVNELAHRIDDWNSQPEKDRERAYEAARQAFQQAGTAWWTEVNSSDPGATGTWFAKGEPADAADWRQVTLPLHWKDDPERRDRDGIEWYRRTVEIPAEWAGKECFVELGPIDDADVLFFDGRAIANTISDWTTGRRYRVPASMVKAGSCTLAIEVLDLHGDGGFTAPAEAMRITCPAAGNGSIPLAGPWLARFGRGAEGIKPPPQRPARDQAPGTGYGDPSSMFNAMIAPFSGFGVRGAIWYQGESNAGSQEDADAYRTLLPLTIRSWRAAFGQPDMPFGIVSLAAFRPHQPDAAVSGIWPTLRDAQLTTERTSPNTGVITTIDVGDAGDIHPRDKRSVGNRLARWATATSYGKPETPWRGPRTKSARRDGAGILISFDVEGGRLATRDGKAPEGFAVAGADGVFVKAKAELSSPNGVKVSSDAVPVPVEVRYAWQDNPADANLFDESSGLPAHPFRIRVEADLIRDAGLPPAPGASSAAPR